MADLPNLAAPDENRTTVQARPSGGGGNIPVAPTDTPQLQVPEFIPRHANMEAAEEVQRILGLATSTASKLGSALVDKKNTKDAAQGAMDQAAGTQNDQLFKNSEAYHAAWSMAGAKAAATQLSQQMQDGANDLFADPNNPPTMDEVHQKLESIIGQAAFNPDGTPVQFGTPQAQLHVAGTLGDVRDQIMAKAQGLIKKDTDNKLLTTSGYNFINDAKTRIAGDGPLQTRAVQKVADAAALPDPLAPLPDPTASQTTGNAITVTQPVQPGGDAGFKNAVAFSMRKDIEGGYNPQDTNGFPTNMGLNGKYMTPAVLKKYGVAGGQLQNLTGPQAEQIYKDRYWDPSGAANLPSAMQTPYFDVYIRSPKIAAQALKVSGTDPHAFLQAAQDRLMKTKAGQESAQSYQHRFQQLQQGVQQSAPPQVDVATSTPTVATPPPTHAAYLDVNGYLDSLPPTVSRQDAKDSLIKQAVNSARDDNDPRILNGLEFAADKDGAHIFTPDEQSIIIDSRQSISNTAEEKADKQLRLTQDANFGKFVSLFVNGEQPTMSSIQAAIQSGAMRPENAYALMRDINSDARQRTAEAKAERVQQNNQIDGTVAGMQEEAAMGYNLSAYTPEKLDQMYKDGTLGDGKEAAARFMRLKNASQQGIKVMESTPDYQRWFSKIHTEFGTQYLPHQPNDGIISFSTGHAVDPKFNKDTERAIAAEFKKEADAGTPLALAYAKAVKQWGTPVQIKSMISELTAKKMAP